MKENELLRQAKNGESHYITGYRDCGEKEALIMGEAKK